MKNSARKTIPKEKMFVIKRDIKKINFSKKYKYIYFDWWFELLITPYMFLCFLLAQASALYFSLKITGKANLKKMRKQGCIVISNHCHYFDTVFLSKVRYPRRLYISVVQRNFEVPVIRRILRFARAFPIPHSAFNFKMIIDPIGEALRRNHHVLFLPEGDLVYLSQEIYRFKPGAFTLSYLHQVPILPFVYVLSKRNKKGQEQVHRPRFHMVIGEPINPPPLRENKELPKEILQQMMDQAADWMEQTLTHYHAQEVPN